MFNAIFAMSNLPSALSNIYKEVAFKDIPDLSVNVVQLWVAVFQAIGNTVFVPIYDLKILGAQRVTFAEMP